MGQEREGGKYFMDDNPENKSKFYYYDPQRIEKQNLPVFKTERMPMNRPGYSEKFGQKTQTQQRPTFEEMRGQDEFQNYMMPGFEQGEQQLNFQLDTDKHDLLNFMPGRSIDN